jgi:hypothetical protein
LSSFAVDYICVFLRKKRKEEKSRKEHREAIFVLEHTSLRYDGKARKEENTNVNNES